METRILSGQAVAEAIKLEVAQQVRSLRARGITPGLAAVLVGDDPASHIYVRSKTRTCRELGIHSRQIHLPADTDQSSLLDRIRELNQEEEVDGILVQLPLPSHLKEEEILASVDPAKDVDGFHPVNVGLLCLGRPGMIPCTPRGILEMLRREHLLRPGMEAVVVGRSNIVGKPMALLLLHEHATVTLCHSRTRDLAEVCRRADLLVAAVGRPALITADFVKEGAVVVDVGINRLSSRAEVVGLFGEDPERLEALEKRGSVLVGDVHPRQLLGKAAALTPVPGGVGPLTIAQLMRNTVEACLRRRATGGRP